jgi:predicted ATPase
MKIEKCHIENFTVFEKQDIEFCSGVNVLIGANATGKSHLLKILYAMVQSVPAKSAGERDDSDILRLYGVVNGVFKPEDGEVNRMIRSDDRKTPAVFHIESNLGHHYAELRRDRHIAGSEPSQLENAPGLFIPPNEVVAIYPGFIASYEKRELAFDQTYYDLCKALSAAPLKDGTVLSQLNVKLEDILQGKVLQKGDRFYVQGKHGSRTLEAHLLAEGHRKIAALIRLINNGSINKDTILFWDEPEANLNPRLVRDIAVLLMELAKIGVQVVVATHDYLLTGELSLAAEYPTEPKVPIRFFALSRENDKPVQVQRGDTLADISDNPILDEFMQHYQREQEAAIEHMR